MMKHFVVLTAVAVTAGTLAATSQARPYHRSTARWYHLTLAQKRVVVVKAIAEERKPLRFWLRHRSRFPESASGPFVYCAAVGIRTPPAICRSSFRLVSAVHVRERIDAKLAVIAAKKATAGHYAGWSCITNGATPLSPHEGDGYNGSYSGPLGMSTPWAGYSPPGSDWVHSDRAAVYAIAEKVAAAHQWDYSWMKGQWPETYPPCAGFFR